MEQTTDLTGFWRFSEDFDGGEEHGEARLFQYGRQLKGYIIFKKIIPDEPPIYIRVKIGGTVRDKRITFSETSVTVLSGGDNSSHETEEKSGLINDMGQITGSGENAQGVHSVFVMDRIF
jgi:hypothetical protein